MATSDVQIVNLALTGIGSARITSLTDDQETARKANAIYELIRDEVLSSYPWKFASKRRALAQLATAPVYGYLYAYQIPSDCLRIYGTDLDVNGLKWSREGETLVTDEGSVSIQYISRQTDPTKFSSAFVVALASRLEAELAYPVSNNDKLAQAKLDVYFKVKLPLAKSLDAQEGRENKAITADGWLEGRSSGTVA